MDNLQNLLISDLFLLEIVLYYPLLTRPFSIVSDSFSLFNVFYQFFFFFLLNFFLLFALYRVVVFSADFAGQFLQSDQNFLQNVLFNEL